MRLAVALLALVACSSAPSPASPGSLVDEGCCVVAFVRYGDDCVYYAGDDAQRAVWICCEVDPPVVPDTVTLEWRCTVVHSQ